MKEEICRCTEIPTHTTKYFKTHPYIKYLKCILRIKANSYCEVCKGTGMMRRRQINDRA